MKTFLFVIGKALGGLLAGASIFLMVCLARLHMLPTELLVAIGILLAAIAALEVVLTWTGTGKVSMSIGLSLAGLMLVGLTVGNVFIHKTLDTLEKISNTDTEIVHVGIYVRADDTNDYNTVAGTYRHGILQTLDRESTDKALHEMEQTFGAMPNCREYQRLPELVDGLLEGQVDAIVLNQAYLDLLQEMPGYEDILEHIRETFLKQVEIELPDSNENNSQETTEDNNANVPDDGLKPFTLFISGIDTRGSMIARSRSDVNIIAVANPRTKQLLLISTPRDYYVPLSISDGIPDKLTHAGIYGVQVCMDTLGMLYDIDIDYYFRVNFGGFVKMIDALGGITVYSDYSFRAEQYYYQKGENTLRGEAALAFCRERYNVSGGDRQRGKNQMAVIQGVVKKALSPSLLQNYTGVLKSVEGSFEMSVPMDVIGNLVAEQLKDGGAWNVVTYSVDGTGAWGVPYSMSQEVYVMEPNYDTVGQAKALIESVYKGEILEK